jgi:hypothetical protein
MLILAIMGSTKRGNMNAQEFRTFLINKVREFDRFAWKDSLENPSEYAKYQQQDWWHMFMEFMSDE